MSRAFRGVIIFLGVEAAKCLGEGFEGDAEEGADSPEDFFGEDRGVMFSLPIVVSGVKNTLSLPFLVGVTSEAETKILLSSPDRSAS